MPVSDLRPIADEALGRRRSTTEIVAGVLRDAIITGVLSAGEELNQVEVARQFGISRVPVREAMRLLEAQGLVISQPHKRTVVSALTPATLEEIFDVRTYLEAAALAAAIPKMTHDAIAELDALVAKMDEDIDHREWMRLNDRFHDALYQPSGKEFTISMIRHLRQQVERYFWAGGHGVRRSRPANAQHHRIVDACRAGDIARAQDELRRHLASTLAGLSGALRGAP